MKLPKLRNTYCPFCRKHTEHKVSEAKQKTIGSAHPNSWGSRRQEAHDRGLGNTGRYNRPPIKQRKMFGKKQSKKVDLRYECSQCKKMHTIGSAWRARRVEFA